jgi:hypothetical protein
LERFVPGFVDRGAPVLFRRHPDTLKHGPLRSTAGECPAACNPGEVLSAGQAYSGFKSACRPGSATVKQLPGFGFI